MRIQPIVAIAFMLLCVTVLQAQELTLPVYHLTVDPDFLDSLDVDVSSNQTYPAQFEYDGERYDCRIRYRGATGRDLPKKSWKVIFDDQGPQGQSETNLNAEYRDISFIRNYLGMRLARLINLPASETQFISLMINDVYHGVFLEVEQVEVGFFNRRDISCDVLFKSGSHGSRFAPPLHYEDISYIYEIKESTSGAYDSLGAFLSYVQYADSTDFERELDRRMDATAILKYFAVMYSIGNADGFSKNFYLYRGEDGRYKLVQWDCDCTFGNDWEGNWIDQSDRTRWTLLEMQGLFQRLISVPERQDELLEIIDNIVNDGFDSLTDSVDIIFDRIRNDVYLDTCKGGSNDDFEREYDRILGYLRDRTEVLSNLDHFRRINIHNITIGSDYIANQREDIIHLEAHLTEQPQRVTAMIIDRNDREYSFRMWDDGTHGDERQGDLIYTGEASLATLESPFYYCCYTTAENTEMFMQPPAGWGFFHTYRLSLPVVRLDRNSPLPDDVEFGPFYYDTETGTYYFALINGTDQRVISLSGCVVRIGNDYRMLRIREYPRLMPNDTLFITNHSYRTEAILPGRMVTGNLNFIPAVDDTIFLQTSSGRVLSSTIVEEIFECEEAVGEVVINEINYNSADDFDSGDWVELYGLRGNHDIGGWMLQDNQHNHRYFIPDQAVLRQGEFLVIAQDPTAFARQYPDVERVIGGFDFGFGGSGDDVRLFNGDGILIDWVAYDDNDPWPQQADGDGPTLELINPSLINFGQDNWRGSQEPALHGTPGYINSVFDDVSEDPVPPLPQLWEIVSTYPCPFNSNVYIQFNAQEAGKIAFTIFDLLGRRVAVIERQVGGSGQGTVVWDGLNDAGDWVVSGVYFIRLDNPHSSNTKRLVLIR
ncbi:MAG: CotH kinase family protein [Candidatus Electryoneaceae bacterium]|nr:CotH kinase family protein [Candidatus Electryoneaceae bacterium]